MNRFLIINPSFNHFQKNLPHSIAHSSPHNFPNQTGAKSHVGQLHPLGCGICSSGKWSFLLLVAPDELPKAGVIAQGSKIRAGLNGCEIAIAEIESSLQRGQSFFFITLPGIGGA
jgi:hypothetical protein